MEQFSDLSRLVKTIAWVWRVARKFLGGNRTLNNPKWEARGRRIVQKVVDSCIRCRKNKAKKCQQVMGELPPERTQPAPPFEFTMVDLFGPYHVKDYVKKRALLKVWGVVFSCMSSRVIHTELVNTQSTESFFPGGN